MKRTGIPAIAVLFLCGVAGAADYSWNGGTGNWDDGTMWTPMGPPGASDGAGMVTGVINLTADQAVGTFSFGLATGNADIQPGNTYSLTFDYLYCRNKASVGARVYAPLAGTGTIEVYDHGSQTGLNLDPTNGGANEAAHTFSGTMILRTAGTLAGSNGGYARIATIGAATIICEEDTVLGWQGDRFGGETLTLNSLEMHDGSKLGTRSGSNSNRDLYGDITLEGDCTFDNDVGALHLRDTISDGASPGRLISTNGSNKYNGTLYLDSANTFTGGVEATGNASMADNGKWGTIVGTVDDAFGTATTANVDAEFAGCISFRYDPTNAELGTVTAHAGGAIELSVATFSKDVTLDGGILRASSSADPDMQGVVTVNADATLQTVNNNRELTVTGTISGSSKLTIQGYSNNAEVILSNDNSATFSGDVEVAKGYLYVNAAGGLGTGNVVAKGGALMTNANGSLDSAASVTADEGGTIDLNSTETATINILPSGTFRITGGSTAVDYTLGSGNVQLQAGCILDSSVPTPTIGNFGVGDGGYGAFLSAATGTHTVGAPSVYRGLAIPPGVSQTFNGTVNENVGSATGIGMLAMTGAAWTYDGATFNAQGANTLKLYGPGNHVIAGAANSFSGDLEAFGTGMVQVQAAGGITGKALTMHKGWLDLNDADALSGANAVVGTGAGGASYVPDVIAASGSVTIGENGFVVVSPINFQGTAGNIDAVLTSGVVSFDAGAGVVFTNGTGTYSQDLPAEMDGQSIFLYDDGRGLQARVTGDIVLDDDSRLSTVYPYNSSEGLTVTGGSIVVASGAGSGRITANTGGSIAIKGAIDFTGKMLIINDADTSIIPESGGKTFVEVVQDGIVSLDNSTATLSASIVEIEAGELRLNNDAQWAAVNTINVAAGAMLGLDYYLYGTGDPQVDATITGNGVVRIGGNGGIDYGYEMHMVSGGALSPGASAGELTVQGDLTLDTGGKLVMEVLGDGNVAGTDHDSVIVTGDAVITEGTLDLIIGAPKQGLVPSAVNATLLTAADLTGTFTTVNVSSPQPLNLAVAPATVASYYDIVVTTDATTASVVGTGTTWTAHSGDANLDNAVDVFDLSVLANNYQVAAAQDWTTADYDQSGLVDVFDLADLANNYGWVGGAGGDPVPEPATLGLIALGALAVIRRRRR